ncbi:MAG: HNH endonuclease, partial [Bacteroidales bacterium]|nr:HNH endonuclease [Bacteroidales bacterium]
MLPKNDKLQINLLSSVFNNTTATYKFYWFVSILDLLVKEGKTRMTFWEIISGMIAESWYPIHYFRLSFGKSDSLNESSVSLQKQMDIPIDASKLELKKAIEQNLGNSRVKSLLRVFTKNVPYRFLSPWITYTYDADVVAKSQVFYNDCLYAIKDNTIEINPIWKDYLTEHYSILRDFAFWNLTLFLQKRNPNVPD